ncbi:type 2 periplasmic-binding domain-containing protein [Massilia orientalis]|uniref:Uncharacterized protein n=1 Tax=Massilia orientalis TaxID=3050128 RepID=A0ACC7MM20_9BURK|nr:hypothetical protein [Massilia sp. YIM B02787]
MNPKLKIIVAVSLWLFGIKPTFAELAIVVNPKNPVSSIATSTLKQIYLGGSVLFTPLEQDEHSSVHAEFYKKVLEKEPAQVQAIWAKLVFTARGGAPQVYQSSTGVKRALSENVNAIGYIEKSSVDDTVKVIAVIR